MNVAAKLEQRLIDKMMVPGNIALFPQTTLAKAVERRLRKRRIAATVFPYEHASQLTRHRYIVICENKNKLKALLALSKQEWIKYPTLILAGNTHAIPSQSAVENICATQQTPSCATGYSFCMSHIYDCLSYAAKANLRGDIIELGSFRGGTLALIHSLAKSLAIDTTGIYGFDSWSGKRIRHGLLDLFDMPEYVGHSYSQVREMLPNEITLVKGDICETVPKWFAKSGNKRRQLLFSLIDTDNYTPVKRTLPLIADATVVGGFILFDHYYTKENFYNTIGEYTAAAEYFDTDDRFINWTGTGIFQKVKS